MNFRKFDIFSQSFQFNIGGQQVRKGTLIGGLMTICILSVTLVYFGYLLNLYFSNQIDPKFRAQSFITEDTTEAALRNDLLGFRFEYDANTSVETLEKQQNVTYLVYYAYFIYQNRSDVTEIPLNITQCTNEDLIGFNCLDFSSLSNYTLEQNTKQNILSQILIYVYGCNDLDSIKTTIPDNCADQKDIDAMINSNWAQYRLKLLTQQYNTTSQKIQSNYRNAYFLFLSNSFIFTFAKTQQQITKIQQGFLQQNEFQFSSPIQYEFSTQNFDRNQSLTISQIAPYFQLNLVMDEIVQQFQIQYPTFPEILSLVNGTFALLMTFGVVGRFLAQKYIKEDIYVLFLQNMYQDTYEQLIQQNKIFEQKERVCLDNQSKKYYESVEESKDAPALQKFTVPSFITKLKQMIDDSPQLKPSSNQQLKDTLETELQQIQQCQTQLVKQDTIFGQIDSNKQPQLQQQQQNILNQMTTRINNVPQLLEPDSIVESQSQNTIQSKLQGENDAKQETQQKQLFTSKFSLTKKTEKNQNDQSQLDQRLKIQSIVPNNKNSIQISKTNETNNTSKEITTRQRVLSISVRKSQQGQSPTLNNYQSKNYENQNTKVINEHFSQKLKLIYDQKISEKIKNAIFSVKLCKKKIDLDLSVKKLIDIQVNKSLDILDLYKEIIFIKKAIMILLTKDQLAAIQLVGCSPYFLSKELFEIEKKKYSEQNEEKKNYFEQQLAISLSQQLQQKYIKKFFSKCQNNDSVSEIDYRILSSILKGKTK